MAALLPVGKLQPGEVIDRLAASRRLRLVLMIDEFDRITDEATRTAMADLVKQCSDSRMPLSLMIIGVSDSPEQLIGRHPSVQRCLARVAVPLLEDAEVEEIVACGAKAGLDYSPAIRSAEAPKDSPMANPRKHTPTI